MLFVLCINYTKAVMIQSTPSYVSLQICTPNDNENKNCTVKKPEMRSNYFFPVMSCLSPQHEAFVIG